MRAVRMHETGGPEVLRVEDIPVPDPGPGQALVRVEVAGVNFVDIYKRTGLYPVQLPATLGQEGAGIVAAVGADVRDVGVGDRVAFTAVQGSYAEYVAAPASALVPVPGDVSSDLAAAVMLQGITAQYLGSSTFPLGRDSRCLVHAAAGGVGLLLVQVAKRRGAFVIGTAGTEEKATLALQAGADHVVVYTKQDFAAEARRLTGGRGVDVVYDSVGQATFLGSLDSLARRGMMVSFGQASGPIGTVDILLLNRKGSLFLTRPSLADYIATREELLQRAGEVLGWVADGSLHVRIDRAYPLDRAADAQRALESRKTAGKVLLRVAETTEA